MENVPSPPALWLSALPSDIWALGVGDGVREGLKTGGCDGDCILF